MLIIALTLICSYIYPEETRDIWISVNYPRTIESNGKKLFDLIIKNNEDTAIYELELLVLNDAGLEIVLDKTKIYTIEPKETVIIKMEIINPQKYYFSKETSIIFKLSNNDYTIKNDYTFTIKPIENFWGFVIISITLILIISFVLIFIKISKGEENVR